MRTMRSFSLPAILVIVLGACGGSAATAAPAASTAPDAPVPSADAPAASADAPAASAEAPPATEAPAAGGGGSAEGVCGLATADELSGILGASVTTHLLQGPPDTCDIQSDGAPIASMTLTLANEQLGLDPALVFQAMTAAPGVTDVPGIGDKAVFDEPGETLIILKGSSLLVVAVYPGAASLEQRQEMMKEIGRIAAGRM
ncbi:MAG TPA: hypothetical protein VFK54_12880 [Candidatus Limnocylindrales bacterium]|nr:hypothetical protein [Candidatus Limnocylindrales bacterium]